MTCLRLHACAHVCVCGCRYHECQPAKASRTAKTATRKCSESRSRETRIGLSLSSTVHLSPSPSLFLVFSLCDIFTYTSSFSILSRSASIFLHPLPDLRSGVRKYYVLTQESSENVTSRYTLQKHACTTQESAELPRRKDSDEGLEEDVALADLSAIFSGESDDGGSDEGFLQALPNTPPDEGVCMFFERMCEHCICPSSECSS